MKKTIIITILLITTACKSQTQIVNIKDQGNYFNRPQNYYFKDVDSLLNPFEGTWLFVNGNKELKIVLEKRVNQYAGIYYEDYIVGGYEYKVNNVSIVNTLPNLLQTSPFKSKYKIWGNGIMKNNYTPPCPECNVGEFRLMLSFFEVTSPLTGTIILRKIEVNGQPALKMNLSGSHSISYKAGTPPPPDDFVVPSGEYILIKQ